MRPRTYILEEDEHLDNLRKIIKRDFFDLDNNDQNSDTIRLSLNDYMANFKSNQNKLFADIVEADKEKFKKDHWWLENQDKILMLEAQKTQKNKKQKEYHNMLSKDPEVNGVDHTITKQRAINEIFFFSSSDKGSILSQQHTKQKKIIPSNCHIDNKDNRKLKDYQKIEKNSYDPLLIPETPLLEGKNLQNAPKGEYPMVRAPSPQPEAVPIMTWGEVQSTPLRIGSSQFSIPETPKREQVLEKLNAKITKQKVEKSSKKNQTMMKILSSSRSVHNHCQKSSARRFEIPEQKKIKKNQADLSNLLNIQKK